MIILEPGDIKRLEEKANYAGLTYDRMMENAGLGVAEYIKIHSSQDDSIVFLLGKGRNAGDGYVAGRILFSGGFDVTLIQCAGEITDELVIAKLNAFANAAPGRIISAYEESGAALQKIQNADLVVDAVFGIGFKPPVRDEIAKIFSLVPKSALKIAVDIPSGLSFYEYDQDKYNGFRADVTLSMLCYKKEHVYKPCSDICGETVIIPIGFLPVAGKGLYSVSKRELAQMMPKRVYNSNKGTYGKTLIIGGCRMMPGAPVIASLGALGTGVGLVTCAFPDCCYSSVTSQLPDSVFIPVHTDGLGEISAENRKIFTDICNNYNSIAFGCGISKGYGPTLILQTLLENYSGILIIDADGLNILSGCKELLKGTKATVLLTPHPGEMSRLTGKSISNICENPEAVASAFAVNYNVAVLLKGANTVIALPNGKNFINSAGCNALSRGGSGDLLTGIIASLAAQTKNISDSAVLGSYIHGKAGDLAAEKYTPYCATIERIREQIPLVFAQIISDC